MQNNLNFSINAAGRYEASFTSSGTLTVIQVNRDQEAPLYVEVSADNGVHRSVLESPRNDKNLFMALNVPEGIKVYVTSLVYVSYASYNQSELVYYTKDEVDNKIAQLFVLEPEYVDTLPTASADTMKKMYFVPKTDTEENNASDEYMTFRSGAGTELDPYTYRWEKVGDTNSQAQADWNQTNTSAPDYIKNKPTIPTVPTHRTINGEQLTDSSLGDINIHDGFYFPNAVQDYDGNWYGAVVIGNQVWLGENLRTKHTPNGTSIEKGTDEQSSNTAYYYDVDENESIYGLLYNFTAITGGEEVTNSRIQGISPNGWYIPIKDDFDNLVTYLSKQKRFLSVLNNSSSISKSISARYIWKEGSYIDQAPGGAQTLNNAAGLNAPPSGLKFLSAYTGQKSETAALWTCTIDNSTSLVQYITWNYNMVYAAIGGITEICAMSVRCISNKTPIEFRNWYIEQYGSLQHYVPSDDEVNVQSDWNQSDSNADDFIKNKPTLGTAAALNVPASGNANGSEVVKGNDSRLTDARNAADVYQWAKAATKPSYTAQEVGAVPVTEKGAAGGVAELDNNGKVPSSQLPSYVDDIVNGYLYDGTFYKDSAHTTAITPEDDKIYVDLTTNKSYRWSGVAYVEVSESLALGETSSTAYAGNKGKANADTIASIIEGLLNGTFVPMLAGDLTPKLNEIQQVEGEIAIRPTGGDNDVKSGDAVLYVIKGALDALLNPFNGDTLVCTGENLINPQAATNGVISDNKIASGSNLIVKFPVANGIWGAYGTTQANNGYIIKGASPVAVRQYAHGAAPAVGDTLATVSTHVEEGKTYYLPSAGWLVVEFAEGTDLTNVSCHLAWSNSHDDNVAVYSVGTTSIADAKNWIHAWGMAALSNKERYIADEIAINGNVTTCYRRTNRMVLSNGVWSVTSTTSQGDGESDPVTTYTYKCEVSDMLENGLWACLSPLVQVEGKTIVVVSTSITTTADLVEALNGYLLYYELATVATSTSYTVSGALTVNDYGLEYFTESGSITGVAAQVVIGYHQNVKDQLLNNVSYVKQLAEVVAAALCQQDARLKAIEQQLGGEGTLTLKFLKVTRQASLPA